MSIYKKKIKLAVIAPPFSGHIYPILELILPLLEKKDKYDISVYTGFQKEEVVKKLGFSVKILLKDKPTAFEKISDTDRQTNPLIAYKQFKEKVISWIKSTHIGRSCCFIFYCKRCRNTRNPGNIKFLTYKAYWNCNKIS